jgi:hypothetical protein
MGKMDSHTREMVLAVVEMIQVVAKQGFRTDLIF